MHFKVGYILDFIFNICEKMYHGTIRILYVFNTGVLCNVSTSTLRITTLIIFGGDKLTTLRYICKPNSCYINLVVMMGKVGN